MPRPHCSLSFLFALIFSLFATSSYLLAQAPTLSSVSPTALSPGMQVTLTGSGFGTSQGGGLVALGPQANGIVVSWSNTQIVVTVPASLVPGNVQVKQNGVYSNGIAFTVVPPTLSSVSPTALSPGMQVTLTGSGFGTSTGLVELGSQANGIVVSWSGTQIVVTVPAALAAGNVRVKANGVYSNGIAFTVVPAPHIASISPTSGAAGATVTINGSNFGTVPGTSNVTFNGTVSSPISWSASQIVTSVPASATSGNVVARISGLATNGIAFTFLPTPNITSLSPNTGAAGSAVTITGTNFGSTGTVTFNGTTATSTSWSPTSIVVPVPTGATTGNVVVTASGVASSGINFVVLATGLLHTSRYQHSATVLNNGKVLIAGGVHCVTGGTCTYLNSAELYDPVAVTSTNTGSLATPRAAPAVLLASGKVLIAGGSNCDSGNCGSQSTAEIYDPTSGTFGSTGNMNVSRDGHTTTLLADGRVLIAGGESCFVSGGGENRGEPLFDGARLVFASFNPAIFSTSCSAQQTAEIYDPASGVFSYTASMHFARYNAAATRLADGRVLIVGGSDEFNPLYSAEIYDPSTNTFSDVPTGLGTARSSPVATLLNNGQVLVASGSTCEAPICPTVAAELYDTATNGFHYTTGGMNVARVSDTGLLLTNGQVILSAGNSACTQINSCTSSASSELYNPVIGTFAATQSLTTARAMPSGTLVSNGNVLLAGGISNGVTLSSVETYTPAALKPPTLVSISITPATPSVFVGEVRQMTAVGTFSDGSTQALQAVIWSSSNTAVTEITNASGSTGFVYAKTTGNSTITATVGSVTGSTVLTVPSLVSMTLYPANPSIAVGVGQQITATGTFSDNSTADLTTSVSWSSSNISVVLIGTTPGFQGFAMGAGSGTATITATLGSVSANTSITVQTSTSGNPPNISGVSPANGSAGVQVTISGSGFVAPQGTGTVWLGSTFGTVVSWTDTQIVAVVADISTSGTVQVQQNGLLSNAVPFNVSTVTISNVSPTSGVPGTNVTISGSGFGSEQGSGQVWLGTAYGVVQSWGPSQVVAQVASGSTSGSAQIMQGGLWSNSVPFTVNSLHITAVTPNSGAPGTSVTITGTGFGSSQGDSSVLLGNVAGQVVSWSDTQVVAVVASNAVSGVARIKQNNVWSNAITFTVSGSGGSTLTIVPNLLNLVVGETHTIQALDQNGQPVTGLTWESSDSNVVSLSTDDPPILSAVAAGHATITAGTASADVTVFVDAPLPGTVIWSNPGDGSGVTGIVPAVPSEEGVADVFAFQGDGTVQAIKSDGTTAWLANVNGATAIPDFQGGLVTLKQDNNTQATSIQKLDGLTGQPYPSFTATVPSGSQSRYLSTPAIHTDGTILTVDTTYDEYDFGAHAWKGNVSVIGINSKTGAPKFTVPLDHSTFNTSFSASGCGQSNSSTNTDNLLPQGLAGPIIAGDGYAYFVYSFQEENDEEQQVLGPIEITGCGEIVGTATKKTILHLKVLRVDSEGNSKKIDVKQWTSNYLSQYQAYGQFNQFNTTVTTQSAPVPNLNVSSPITNADTGSAFGWQADASAFCASETNHVCSDNVPAASSFAFAVTADGSQASVVNTSTFLNPVLQAQDGTFYGTDSTYSNMIHFNLSGNTLWSVPNEYPYIATADGGVTGYSGINYDSQGRATGQTSTPIQSWTGNGYQYGSVVQVVTVPPSYATSYAAMSGGNPSAAAGLAPASTYIPSLGAIYRAQVAADAKGYVGNSTTWAGGEATCNIFVHAVLTQASNETSLNIPAPTRPPRKRYGLTRIDAFLAADWANSSTNGECWKPLPAGPDGALPGDVIATGWPPHGNDDTGHVGIVVEPNSGAPNYKDASAAAVPPYWWTPAQKQSFISGTVTLTDYGFRPPGFDFTDPNDVQGLKQDSHVRRFLCY